MAAAFPTAVVDDDVRIEDLEREVRRQEFELKVSALEPHHTTHALTLVWFDAACLIVVDRNP